MRRGFRNRWARDLNPHDQGIVSFGGTNYVSPEELANRDKSAGTLALLKKYGWYAPTPRGKNKDRRRPW